MGVILLMIRHSSASAVGSKPGWYICNQGGQVIVSKEVCGSRRQATISLTHTHIIREGRPTHGWAYVCTCMVRVRPGQHGREYHLVLRHRDGSVPGCHSSVEDSSNLHSFVQTSAFFLVSSAVRDVAAAATAAVAP